MAATTDDLIVDMRVNAGGILELADDHKQLPVEHPAILRPDDVARGKDAVADAAVRWINRQN